MPAGPYNMRKMASQRNTKPAGEGAVSSQNVDKPQRRPPISSQNVDEPQRQPQPRALFNKKQMPDITANLKGHEGEETPFNAVSLKLKTLAGGQCDETVADSSHCNDRDDLPTDVTMGNGGKLIVTPYLTKANV
jgi:hypothetical protein